MTFVTIGIVSSWLIFNNKRRRPATKSREVNDIHHLEKRRSGSNYLWDRSVMTTLSLDPRGDTILALSNYLVIAALGLLFALPVSTLHSLDKLLLDNVTLIAYYLLVVGIMLKLIDYALYAKSNQRKGHAIETHKPVS
jgi:hypothetical protein